jgi:hypothetical protein
MRGPLFNQLIQNREYNLREGETIADLERMYTILIESRGKNINTLTRFDETVTLAALCQYSFPGKTPAYRSESQQLRADFKGISTNLVLENRFRDKVRLSFKNALNENQIDFRDIRNLFFD